MRKFKLFTTDFYQISMTIAYILSGKANVLTGFESFYRHPKKEVNSEPFYFFSGEKEVHELMAKIREELKDPNLVEGLLVFADRFTVGHPEIKEKIKTFFKDLDTDFEYTVYKEGAVLPPYVPAFQYKGPKWIGQLLETLVTNIINGRTGLNTQIQNRIRSGESVTFNSEVDMMKAIVFGERDNPLFKNYMKKVFDKSIEFRNATNNILLDASFRRAPSYEVAVEAAKIAIQNNWNGTSNTGSYYEFPEDVPLEKIGGTMAHAFVMSFESELEAFKTWDSIFPNSAILVDTYDTINAVKMLIENDIKPESVRIDSGDFRIVCREVREILDNAGWKDVGIYISGDMTPELLISLEKEGVPFNKSMAGTKFVNIEEGAMVNGGFVYKVVEYTDENGNRVLPEKKAEGKTNYPGLKTVSVHNGQVILDVKDNNIGYIDLDKITTDMTVSFNR